MYFEIQGAFTIQGQRDLKSNSHKGLCTNHVDKLRGRGVAQMSTLLNKSYLVKVSTKGERGQKCPKFCLRGLYTAP